MNKRVSWLSTVFNCVQLKRKKNTENKTEEEFHLKINDEIYFMANCIQLKLNALPQLFAASYGPCDLLIAIIHNVLWHRAKVKIIFRYGNEN